MILLVPEKKSLLLYPLIFIVEKYLKRHITIARVLAWSPSVAVSSLILEIGIELSSRKLSKRLAALIRLKVSHTTACPFCIDINSANLKKDDILSDEYRAIKDKNEERCTSFSEKERAVLEWIGEQSNCPLYSSSKLDTKLQAFYKPKELVIIAALGAKVNYWARFSHALRIPAEGFSKTSIS